MENECFESKRKIVKKEARNIWNFGQIKCDQNSRIFIRIWYCKRNKKIKL